MRVTMQSFDFLGNWRYLYNWKE